MSRSGTGLFHRLPGHLFERCSAVQGGDIPSRPFVLYWMRTAARGHENPALDVALECANMLGRPVFVYHGLSERYPYASDRHHRFILEGAREVQAELESRGIGYGFHLGRPGHRGPYLKQLGGMACLVVTEDMPTPPMRRWTERLCSAIDTPVWTVDTACILPMSLSLHLPERAFRFREELDGLRAERLVRPWMDVQPERGPYVPSLPFQPLDLSEHGLGDLVALCEIDHSIAAVSHSPGGQGEGYERWRLFRDLKLQRYHLDRSRPDREGTSRLSPYLHYGHVSPFRIAREASAFDSEGARKFLDELLVWREMAYHWCSRVRSPGWESLPRWAKRELVREKSARRPALYAWEELRRAKTEDPVWNLCQLSLLLHGELHGALRMVWGKMFLRWTKDPQTGLRWMTDLNHRFALDGRDPVSYGGLLWCFGLFDRPFQPPSPVYGTVRSLDVPGAVARLDTTAFARRLGRPATSTPSVAVLGGGMAGLSCARVLSDHRADVVVFESLESIGGRLSALSCKDGGWRFDQGAPFAVCSDRRFSLQLRAWENLGLACRWEPRQALFRNGRLIPEEDGMERWVGVPSMSSLAAGLAGDLDIRPLSPVDRILRTRGEWRLYRGEEPLGSCSELVLAVSPMDAVRLVPEPLRPAFLGVCAGSFRSCFCVMVHFAEPLGLDFDLVRFDDPVLEQAVRESSKPHRPGMESWVLQTQPFWSKPRMEIGAGPIGQDVVCHFLALFGLDVSPLGIETKSWNQARRTGPSVAWRNPKYGMSLCGDWMQGDTLEDAYLSGIAAAGRLLSL
jgi:photolyase PhrII